MNPREVFLLAAQHGVNLIVVGDGLKVDPLPTCRGIPDALVDGLRQHKMGIIKILAEPNPHGNCTECGTDTESIMTTITGERWLCSDCLN